jgi:3-methyladenine DNA glycosylase AlkD
MTEKLNSVIETLAETEHGFKHIMNTGDALLAEDSGDHFTNALSLLEDSRYQSRMLGTYLLGQLSPADPKALKVLRTTVAADENWRVQEMLAKAFDYCCSVKGYQKSLPLIREWLSDSNANVKRAVVEGLRIWTSRAYFKEHPTEAIALISVHKSDDSEYLRKSVGNALRDISRQHYDLVASELRHWDTSDLKAAFTRKFVEK